ncbi:MAG: endonuclease/exonuclease/phosphatase family protein [Clostridia bacterium]|nr:endonuclease/exonuclease/phosphatase family protein [Clostridia bacterium]
MATIRLMSHNQWKCDKNLPAWESQGLDCSAKARTRGFARVFRDVMPDVVGCQEVSALMADNLIRFLQEDGLRYALLWGRDTPILYRQDKLELIDSDFALYPEECPGFEGSFNNSMTKSRCHAVFRVKENGKCFIFTTTHLWWKSSNPESANYQPGSTEARVYQLGLAIEEIDAFQKKYNCPAILVGDLNASYNTKIIARAFEGGFVHAHDVAVEFADDAQGYHSCGADGYGPYRTGGFPAAIDHILVRGADDGFVRRFERFSPEYYLPLSDHSPVFIDAEL